MIAWWLLGVNNKHWRIRHSIKNLQLKLQIYNLPPRHWLLDQNIHSRWPCWVRVGYRIPLFDRRHSIVSTRIEVGSACGISFRSTFYTEAIWEPRIMQRATVLGCAVSEKRTNLINQIQVRFAEKAIENIRCIWKIEVIIPNATNLPFRNLPVLLVLNC